MLFYFLFVTCFSRTFEISVLYQPMLCRDRLETLPLIEEHRFDSASANTSIMRDYLASEEPGDILKMERLLAQATQTLRK